MAKPKDEPVFEVKPRAKMGNVEISRAQAELFHGEAVQKAGDWLADDDEIDDDTREILRGEDETSKEDEQEAIRRSARRRNDPSLTEKENALTEHERAFVVEFVRLEKAKAAALAAGYAPSCAASKASKLLKDPRIVECIEERRRRQSRLLGLSDDFVLEGYLEIYNRSMQNIPAFDRDGNPTGYFSYDGATALRALESIARVKGMDRKGPEDEKEVKDETIAIREDVGDIARLLRAEADKNKVERAKE